MQTDGFSLDDKRQPLLPEAKQGVTPAEALTPAEHEKNNLPDALTRWLQRDGAEQTRARTAQSFVVPKAEIAAADWDLSLNRYKEIVRDDVKHRSPREILAELVKLEDEIRDGMTALEAMLS
jgi:type I restriction enzyme M protein